MVTETRSVQLKDLGHARVTVGAEVLERTLVGGDLKDLTSPQRVQYYAAVCASLGLNPLTRPFEYITLNGKLTLYAKRDATDQLRKLQGVSITRLQRDRGEDVYVVTATALDKHGRTDESIGAVSLTGLKGEALANALMKAETKAKRRVTLSIVGLGWLDETEIETVPDARAVTVDEKTGEILAHGEAAAHGFVGEAKAAPLVVARLPALPASEPHGPPPITQGSVDAVTAAQTRMIYALAHGQKLGEEEVADRCQQMYGVTVSGLTRRDASAFIDSLKVKATG